MASLYLMKQESSQNLHEVLLQFTKNHRITIHRLLLVMAFDYELHHMKNSFNLERILSVLGGKVWAIFLQCQFGLSVKIIVKDGGKR